MDDRPSKGKIAAFVAAVVVATGVMAWALYESFKADQNRFEDFTDDAYYGDESDDTALEAEPAAPAAKPEETPKAAVPAKPAAKP